MGHRAPLLLDSLLSIQTAPLLQDPRAPKSEKQLECQQRQEGKYALKPMPRLSD